MTRIALVENDPMYRAQLEEYLERYSGADNHLSTEGMAVRTEQIIRDLKAQLEKEGI